MVETPFDFGCTQLDPEALQNGTEVDMWLVLMVQTHWSTSWGRFKKCFDENESTSTNVDIPAPRVASFFLVSMFWTRH